MVLARHCRLGAAVQFPNLWNRRFNIRRCVRSVACWLWDLWGDRLFCGGLFFGLFLSVFVWEPHVKRVTHGMIDYLSEHRPSPFFLGSEGFFEAFVLSVVTPPFPVAISHMVVPVGPGRRQEGPTTQLSNRANSDASREQQ